MGKRTIYKDADGKRVPGVTTVLSRFKESGGLIHWANQQGLNGLTLEEARKSTADAGTLAHDFVEAHINGWDEPDVSGKDVDTIKKARNAFSMYLTWQAQTKLEVKHTEVSLVSEAIRTGGRIDAVGEGPDRLRSIIDWKTGPTYVDHLLQLAAYEIIWNDNYPDDPINGGAHVCSFNRDTGDFSHRYFGDLSEEREVFKMMRELYDRIKPIEKRAK